MKRDYLRAVCTTLILACALVVFTSETTRAQESERARATEQAETTGAGGVSVKFDEYDYLRYCSWTARLDNLATQLQNSPTMKAYVISFDASKKNYEFAESELQRSHFYLTRERGIDASRIVLVNGGRREDAEIVLTELWTVPEGAPPPVAPPETDKYTAKDFSGRFDVYSTDETTYQETYEMGYTGQEISHFQFAAKLKQQPDSVGYLLVRSSKNSPPGAWRRIARRDEAILQKDHGVEAARLRSIGGGQSGGERAQVELWILPKSAPPPEGAKEKVEPKTRVAYKLNRYDYYGERDTDAERWMLENLAEALRDDPRASGYLVVRQPAEQEEIDADVTAATSSAATESAQVGEESPQVEEEPAQVEEESAQGVEADAANSAGAVEVGQPKVETVAEITARLKKILSEKHGIEPHRIVVVEGRRMPGGSMRLTAWAVPEKAQPPDAFARDADEPEEDLQESTETQESTRTQEGTGEQPSAIEVVAPVNEVAPLANVRASGVASRPSYETLKDGRETNSLNSKTWL